MLFIAPNKSMPLEWKNQPKTLNFDRLFKVQNRCLVYVHLPSIMKHLDIISMLCRSTIPPWILIELVLKNVSATMTQLPMQLFYCFPGVWFSLVLLLIPAAGWPEGLGKIIVLHMLFHNLI